jgi:hypothetical protein
VSDGVNDLRSHIDAAHQAAEQLVREAEDRARAHSGSVPPSGWDVPGSDEEADRPAFGELQSVVALLDSVRRSLPAELTVQLAEALRELLVAVRALLDWYIDRLERFKPGEGGPGSGGEPRVQDIPIE